MATARIDVLDLASEVDLQKMERIMSLHPEHTIEVIYSPYIMLVWKDSFNIVRLGYFERQSQKDMKLAEEIMNNGNVMHQNMNVQFPFAFIKWAE